MDELDQTMESDLISSLQQRRSIMADVDWNEYQVHWEYGEQDDNDDSTTAVEDVKNDNTELMFRLFDPDHERYDIFECELPSDNKITRSISVRYRRESSNSTGLGFWTGAELMGNFLVEHPELVQGKHVLELGSGVGFCALVAYHACGAKRVLVTDGDVHVLKNLRYNIQQNTSTKDVSSIACPQLIWGSKHTDVFLRDYGRQDVIMASDCVYMTKSLVPLWQTVSSLLHDDGVFLYVNECASQAPAELVLKTACENGFTWQVPAQGVFVFQREQSSKCSLNNSRYQLEQHLSSGDVRLQEFGGIELAD